MDMLLTTGERMSMSLLAMAIRDLGFDARSFTGSQAGMMTDAQHGRARIVDVTPPVFAPLLMRVRSRLLRAFKALIMIHGTSRPLVGEVLTPPRLR